MRRDGTDHLGLGNLAPEAPDPIDFSLARGLDRPQLEELCTSDWVSRRENVLITGPIGTGKSFLARTLGQRARAAGNDVAYYRVSRLVCELGSARTSGCYVDLLIQLARTDLLILDDFGVAELDYAEQRDLLDIVDDRDGCLSLAITSPLAVEAWTDYLGDIPLARAFMDRVTHNAHCVALKGQSLRKRRRSRQAARLVAATA